MSAIPDLGSSGFDYPQDRSDVRSDANTADDADAEHHRKPAYYFFDGIALKGIGGPNYVHVATNDCY